MCFLFVHTLIFLTRNRPEIRLWCPRPKLNMDDFSVLAASYVCVDATQEKELNSLHALMGIGKGIESGIICIRYLDLTFCHESLQGTVDQWIMRETSNPKIRGTKPGRIKTFFLS